MIAITAKPSRHCDSDNHHTLVTMPPDSPQDRPGTTKRIYAMNSTCEKWFAFSGANCANCRGSGSVSRSWDRPQCKKFSTIERALFSHGDDAGAIHAMETMTCDTRFKP